MVLRNIISAALAIAGLVASANAAETVSFTKDILPIISDKCLFCHGPDRSTRKAGLRLDTREGALDDSRGDAALVPGNTAKSALFTRITSKDPEELMPPPKSGKTLKPEQIELLRRWIEQGGKYEKHWSFNPPERPTLSALAPPLAAWVKNPIDAWVAARLSAEALAPSPEAPPRVIARRIALDLTGLPPKPKDVDEFVLAYARPESREATLNAWIEKQLHSPHYGERMAMFWLDAARYSDTDGYQADDTRANWPWRDWVIAAYNSNMPYDQFTLEQLAGDLLPNATPEQKLATCFHRNHMTNGEGGRDPEESRVDYVIDRVSTTGTIWQGLTLGCCQCHSHKFDPVSQSEFYQLSAFFNSIEESGKAGKGANPYLGYTSPYGKRALDESQKFYAMRQAEEAAARKAAATPFNDWLNQKVKQVGSGFTAWHTFKAEAVESIEGTKLEQQADGCVLASGPNPDQDDYRVIGPVTLPRITGFKLEVLPHESMTGGGSSRSETGHFILTDIKVQVRNKHSSQLREITVENAVADYSADTKKHGGYGDIKATLDDDPRNGWTNLGTDAKLPHTALFAFEEPEEVGADEELIIELRQRALKHKYTLGRFRISLTDQAGSTVLKLGASPLERLALAKPVDTASVGVPLTADLLEDFLADYAQFAPVRKGVARAKQQVDEMKKAAGKLDVMVLAESAKPRETHVLLRGVWDKHGDKVDRGVPTAIAPWPDGQARTRAGLARWLTDKRNPLTARVTVNHLWQLFFGAGLVRTPEDFGLQGEAPTHPELLDWLAVELIESKWDLQRVIRLMLSSATYLQSSNASEALLTRDPQNRLLARGSRYRLPSWMIRDAALEAGGLLNTEIGGPPVRPYQPSGVWEDITMGRFKYRASEGPDQYRRSVYAFWRRSSAPTFLFDSSARRVCEVRTLRTNTPLQALTLMNDLSYVESARALAEKAMRADAREDARLAFIFKRVLSREPTEREKGVLKDKYSRVLALFRSSPTDAAQFIAHGQSKPDARLDASELAANAVVAGIVLNLDEAVTRE